MRSRYIAGLLIVGASGILGAQRPGAPAARQAGPPAAQILLAHTGELQLTDAQVLRLAAIARRAETRHQSMRASMDSARGRFQGRPATPADSTARRQFAERMRTDMERMGEQERTDRRDAIAVLTPDQQARAWEFAANRGNRGEQMRGGRRPTMQRPMQRQGQRPMQRGAQRPVRPVG
ncbi:MAG: Spy/CpxP family protein refolding chaperone [Gemmatimonadaceae bacterium]